MPSRPLVPSGGALRPWLGLALVCAGFSLHPKFLRTFWTREYLPNVVQQSATNIILAVGMTFVILTGGIDLSVGSVMALCGVALGMTVKTGPPPFLACAMALPAGVLMAALTSRLLSRRGAAGHIASGAVALLVTLIGGMVVQQATVGGIRLEGALIATLMVGAACGLLNGLFITLGRVPPFVVTLGMMTAARGLTVYATDGNSVSGLPPRLGALGVGVPLIAVTLAVVALSAVLLLRTRAGRYMLSIGGNEEAARLSGVNVTAYKTLAYLLSGITSAIAAIVLTAKFQLADTGAGMGAELNAIAAVVIGGTSLSGGRGSVIGTLIGALTIQVLNAGLVIIGVRDTLQLVIIGAVIVVTVMMDRYWTSP
ncbi:MAG: ABC transporter permease [Abditibacteriales bacterium]|nr:ABC transporter permease [Abditibacteriales bacterium]MDW8366056.1 ABC transporter permease [Abditibacteriales bacterium]